MQPGCVSKENKFNQGKNKENILQAFADIVTCHSSKSYNCNNIKAAFYLENRALINEMSYTCAFPAQSKCQP